MKDGLGQSRSFAGIWYTLTWHFTKVYLFHMCQGLNSHYCHITGGGHQPNSKGLYIHYKDSLSKVGWPSPISGVSTLVHIITMTLLLLGKVFCQRRMRSLICVWIQLCDVATNRSRRVFGRMEGFVWWMEWVFLENYGPSILFCSLGHTVDGSEILHPTWDVWNPVIMMDGCFLNHFFWFTQGLCFKIMPWILFFRGTDVPLN